MKQRDRRADYVASPPGQQAAQARIAHGRALPVRYSMREILRDDRSERVAIQEDGWAPGGTQLRAQLLPYGRLPRSGKPGNPEDPPRCLVCWFRLPPHHDRVDTRWRLRTPQ